MKLRVTTSGLEAYRFFGGGGLVGRGLARGTGFGTDWRSGRPLQPSIISLGGGGTGRLAVTVNGPLGLAGEGWWDVQELKPMLAVCRCLQPVQGRCSREWALVSEATDVTTGSYHFFFFGGGGLVGRASLAGDGAGPL